MQLHLPPLPSNYFDRQFLPSSSQKPGGGGVGGGGGLSWSFDDAKLISCDMPADRADYVIHTVRSLLSRRRVNERVLPRELKEDLDRQFGPSWQVVVTSGQFWCWFTHTAGNCLIFKCQRYCFLVWRTKSSHRVS